MSASADLGFTLTEVRRHLEANPADGEGDDAGVRAVRSGPLSFVAVDENGHQVTSDMSESVGGSAAAMSPGTLLRGALACCTATSVAILAATDGIELTRLEVEVQSRSDDRGVFGLGGVPPEPLHVRVIFRLESPTASDEQLRELADEAERRSPVAQALRRGVAVATEFQGG